VEDRELIAMLWNRAEDAISALQNCFGKRLYRTAMNILGSHRDAEEAVNDTYLAVWNTIPPKRPEPLAPFVYRTGRNIALQRLRDMTAQKRNSSYDLSLEELEGCIPGGDLAKQLDARLLGQAIDAFLDTLSRENRQLFLRRYWFGDSVQEIAKDFGLAAGTVSVRLNRIKDKLRTYLTKEGLM